MPVTRASLDISQFLTGADCDVAGEYNTVLDAAHALERKYSSIMEHAQQLKSTLRAKQAEIEQIAARHQAELASYVPRLKVAEKVPGLRHKLRASRREAGKMREDLRHSRDDLAATLAELRSTKTTLTAAQAAQAAEHAAQAAEHAAKEHAAITADLHHTKQKLQAAQQELHTLRHVRGDLEFAKGKLDLVAELDCGICFENIKDRFLSCGHAYCSGCVEELGSEGQITCPHCRKNLSVRDVRKLFISAGQSAHQVVIELSDNEST